MLIILPIRAITWASHTPQELTLVLCLNHISPLVHTNPHFPDGEDKAQVKSVSLGQSWDASPGRLSPHAGVLPPLLLS